MTEEQVIIVNEKDEETGLMPKIEAHELGVLHRALSVFVFNSAGHMLLQQRNAGKYHSGGLWSNTCCSHPRPGEDTLDAASRRLFEEMGLACVLEEIFSFMYVAKFGNGLVEHEYDHVFVGICDQLPSANAAEVSAWAYLSKDALEKEIKIHPENFTEWFKLCLNNWSNQLFSIVNKNESLQL